MTIKQLFELYNTTITSKEESATIFSKSGMLNEVALLDFGFFPIGSGVFTAQSKIEEARLEVCNVMVIGNDFGTMDYVLKDCPDKREKLSNPTIRNLVGDLGLDLSTTFFTNLFLGLRSGGTNIQRVTKIHDDYRQLSFDFLKVQLDFFNPKIVLCLGKDVGQALAHFSKKFSNFSLEKESIAKLYAGTINKKYIVDSKDDFLGVRKFVLIPHPSFAHINWAKNDIKAKIQAALRPDEIAVL